MTISPSDMKQITDAVRPIATVAKADGKFTIAMSIIGFLATAALVIGGWIWWGSDLNTRVVNNETRIKAMESRLDSVATKEDVSKLTEKIDRFIGMFVRVP